MLLVWCKCYCFVFDGPASRRNTDFDWSRARYRSRTNQIKGGGRRRARRCSLAQTFKLFTGQQSLLFFLLFALPLALLLLGVRRVPCAVLLALLRLAVRRISCAVLAPSPGRAPCFVRRSWHSWLLRKAVYNVRHPFLQQAISAVVPQ